MGEEAPPVACTTTTDILNPAIYGGAQCVAKARLACEVYVTVAEKADHLAQVSDIEILVPRCSALFTLCNGVVRIAIAFRILCLHT